MTKKHKSSDFSRSAKYQGRFGKNFLSRIVVALSTILAGITSFAQTSEFSCYSISGDHASRAFHEELDNLGDLNNDGIDDLLIEGNDRLYIYSGSDGAQIRVVNLNSGSRGYPAGDINFDGYADYAISSTGETNDQGVTSGLVRVYSGADGTLLRTFEGETEGEVFGIFVSRAGDMDGDGYGDLIVGSMRKGKHETNGAKVRVFSGFDGSMLASIGGLHHQAVLEASVVGVGDLDGDGLAEIIVGAPVEYVQRLVRRGSAYIYSLNIDSHTNISCGNQVGSTQNGKLESVVGAGAFINEDNIYIDAKETENRAPVISHIGNKEIMEMLPLSFTVNATDHVNNVITYSVSGLPSGATFNAQTQEFSWTPQKGQAGSYKIRFFASDGFLSSSEVITIEVGKLINTAPYFTEALSAYTKVGEYAFVQLFASDDENDKLTYHVRNLPDNAMFLNDYGDFFWRPEAHQVGTHTVTFWVSDGEFTVSKDVTIYVESPIEIPAVDVTELSEEAAVLQLETSEWQGHKTGVVFQQAGAWVLFDGVPIPSSGTYLVELDVASAELDGWLLLEDDQGRVLGFAEIPNTAGRQEWATVTMNVELYGGNHDFRVTSGVPGSVSFSSIRFTPVE